MATQIKTILATSIMLIAASQAAVAAPSMSEITIDNVGYAGNGCPEGSASVVLAPDKKSVSVLFDDYIAEAGGQGQRTFERKKCDIAFGLKVPEGLSVSLIDADYRGYNNLPRGASASFTRDYFFAGSNGPSLTANWSGARSATFDVKDSLTMFADVWSACGADVIMRSKTAATVRTQRGNEAMMMVDSADLTTKTVYRYNFRYRQCN